jgi:hypothetical protein
MSRLRTALAAGSLLLATAAIAAPAGAVTFGGSATIASGLNSPQGIAADADGNVFIADTSNGRVLEIPPGCATSSCEITYVSDLTGPTGLTLDASGNLYIAESGQGRVLKVAAGCRGNCPWVTAASGIGAAGGIAIDSTGTIYAAMPGQGTVISTTASCGGAPQCVTTFTGFTEPTSVDLEANGYLLVADAAAGDIFRFDPTGCTDSSCASAVPLMVEGQPTAVTHDDAGDVFVLMGNIGVIEIPAGCSATSCERMVTPRVTGYGIATDPAANLYVANIGAGTATEYRSVVSSGTFSLTTTTMEPGDSTIVTSTNPCPAAAGSARVELVSSSSHQVAGHSDLVTVDSGGNWQMTYTVPAGTPRGSYGLTGQCVGGDGSYDQTYAFVNVTVPGVTTTTTLFNPAMAGYSDGLGLSATITPAVTTASPIGGTVSFIDQYGDVLGTVPVGANGKAYLRTNTPDVGTYYIHAIYSGDSLYYGSTSDTRQTTVVTVGSRIVPSTASKKTGLFKARLLSTASSGAPIPAGQTLTFSTKNPLTGAQDTVCQALTDAYGFASCTGKIPALDSLDDKTYTVSFAGTNDYRQSSTTGTLGS